MSGIGKGIAASSIAKIIQAHDYSVTSIKIDPYVNVDAGTMNPTEHGEVFVLADGLETDQDMGNYERFLNIKLPGSNYMTTGSVYGKVINNERNLKYKGKCVQIIPHVTDEVINTIEGAATKNEADVVITEVGGTTGDYENVLFTEAARQLKLRNPEDVLFVMITFVPYPKKIGEMKTKPTQQAARALNEAGVQPDIIIARSGMEIDKKRKEKIALFCNIQENAVVSAPDSDCIYEIPLNFEKDGLSSTILKKLGLENGGEGDLADWKKMVDKMKNSKEEIRIGMVGKYFGTGDCILADSYISVIEALKHAAFAQERKPVIDWINAEEFEKDDNAISKLDKYDALIVPGGFGSRGIEGKIKSIQYARENKIPYLGLCYGMQLLVIEYARNVVGLKDANTAEINPDADHLVVDIMPEQKSKMEKSDYGATMRLGDYPCEIKEDTLAYNSYEKKDITERHRHRYEVNPEYIKQLEEAGLIFSGQSPDGKLMEIAEIPKSEHPFMMGSQFHPEFTSSPLCPNPLFSSLIAAAIKNKK